ncbi:30S ribosomal protein S1 [Candidatus Poribacteria bacterium]|jgi:small subunit ribosomal protein S1|nr:30S ribosomal protein S1 [Candidatus Poribacteria bacterium]MBT5531654.1 30S ribosomal protein S1 [Candidatus Poribacteria bacterium]MBT7095848.1 30S ribosomal protein S1 [Candidatus Poribacteria bacterium]MBT7807175.1 30S ribosomal protein S1 [Candidatus Poribacteria bacterium]
MTETPEQTTDDDDVREPDSPETTDAEAADSAEEPAPEAADDSADEQASEAADEPAEEQAPEATDDAPVAEAADDSAEEQAPEATDDEPAAEAADEPAEEQAPEATDDAPVAEAADDSAEEPASEATDTAEAPDAPVEAMSPGVRAPGEPEREMEEAPAAGVNAIDLPDDDVFTDEQLAAAYDQTMRHIQEGEVVRGTVLKLAEESVLVDIGYKSEGTIPLEEFPLGEDGKPQIAAGDELDVYLVRLEDADGSVVLSKVIADQRRVWDDIAEAYEGDRPVKGTVTRRIKGGLRVEIGSMYAFLPASQVDIRPVPDLDTYLGRDIEMRVIKLNRRRRNIVLSRRVLLEEARESMRQELLETLAAGQTRHGVVKNITQFGAFIDLGGLDGLLHKSDMSWGRVSHPADFVERDQEIDVMVLSINRESGKVSLGLKQLTKDPWEGIADKFPVASDAVGRVVNIVDYGAFVELEEGVEGLVHVSEMSWTRRNIDPHTVLGVGDEVTVRILNVDPDRQKISLGLKQLAENPWDRLERDKPVGARVAGRVRNITDFGVFVEIEEGIDGLIHVSDLSWTKRVEPDEMLQEGAEIEVVILDVDRDRERVSLGLKQLEPDPWLDVPEKYKVGTTVEAQIVNLTNFGAFAKLEDGIEGLIHISELSDQHVEDPIEVVRVGDSLDVKVINLDLQDRRIGLSRKAYIADQHRTEAVEQDAPTPVAPTAAPARPQPQPRGREREQERERPRERSAGGTTLGDLIDQAQRDLTDDDDGDSDDEE